MTHILEERKLEGLVFLNITSYGSGTDPWGSSKSDGVRFLFSLLFL